MERLIWEGTDVFIISLRGHEALDSIAHVAQMHE